jgi:hypothetical protein
MAAVAPAVDDCPAIAIDLDGVANEYSSFCALVIDVGGADTYLNNAGGSHVDGANVSGWYDGECRSSDVWAAGALVDLAGDDAYTPRTHCGVNGGGYNGAGFLLDVAGNDVYTDSSDTYAPWGGTNGGGDIGIGFLLDMAGDDTYTADRVESRGINGGGNAGAGFLLDAGGDDLYVACSACHSFANDSPGGATNGGAYEGTGFLLDAGGDDAYRAANDGTNGGALEGKGFLFDMAGNDTYRATDIGTNGGGHDGAGFLFDAAGNDVYMAGTLGTNGGATLGSGLLLDTSGFDSYYDEEYYCGGTGTDRTVVVKGDGGMGAQVDLQLPLPTTSLPPALTECFL